MRRKGVNTWADVKDRIKLAGPVLLLIAVCFTVSAFASGKKKGGHL